MDWFHRITGFAEARYEDTQPRLSVQGDMLCADGKPTRWNVGRLRVPSLGELRSQAASLAVGARTKVSIVQGDVRKLHAEPSSAGALFQVASQFNLLEMVGPSVSPEDGVTRYEHDRTQGPACAIAAGAATIFRNYLVELPGGTGQTSDRQVDASADLGAALGNADGKLWRMVNGYALFTREGLAQADAALAGASEAQLDAWRALLRIGLHTGVQVTDVPDRDQRVSQAFCSALPVSYNRLQGPWGRVATLVLEAAYEATLLAARVAAAEGGSPIVFLTRLGGGAFGNDDRWIDSAMRRALKLARDWGLDVRVVSYGPPTTGLKALVGEFSR